MASLAHILHNVPYSMLSTKLNEVGSELFLLVTSALFPFFTLVLSDTDGVGSAVVAAITSLAVFNVFFVVRRLVKGCLKKRRLKAIIQKRLAER